MGRHDYRGGASADKTFRMKPLIHLVAGTRADFVKLVPLARAILASGRLEHQLIDAGHLDPAAVEAVLDELGIPQPAVRLASEDEGGYRGLCRIVRPDALVVAGGSEAGIACARVAKRMSITVVQAEGGLRSGEDSPEEAMRIEADGLASRHFVSDESGVPNLVREGQGGSHVLGVGSLVVDNLFYQLAAIQAKQAQGVPGDQLKKVVGGRYGVVAVQDAANLGNAAAMERITAALREASAQIPLVFSVAPSTRASLERSESSMGSRVLLLRQLRFLEFVNLCKDAAIVLTDDGCVQEEATALGVPCVTLRDATERCATVDAGTNVLVGAEPTRIVAAVRRQLERERAPCRVPLWDGAAATRIADALADSMMAAA